MYTYETYNAISTFFLALNKGIFLYTYLEINLSAAQNTNQDNEH